MFALEKSSKFLGIKRVCIFLQEKYFSGLTYCLCIKAHIVVFNKYTLQIFHSLGITEEIINQEDLKLQNYVWDESSLRFLYKKEIDF